MQVSRGCTGFDVGSDTQQGMPRFSLLVNPSETNQLRTTNVTHSPLKHR
jgi:hypothetical protein